MGGSRRTWAARAAVALATVVAATAIGAAPAYAAAQNHVWVADGFLYYEYTETGPRTNLVVRNSGTTVTLQDAFGLFIGDGCRYPTEFGYIVECTVTTGYRIETGPHDDFVDILLTGPLTTISGVINGFEGNDTILASDGPSKLWGQGGNDVINGRGGNDFLIGASGADRMFGGGGNDTVFYNGTVGVTASLDGVAGNDGAPGEGDTIGSDVENLEGTPFDDVLTGSGTDNRLVGCGGNDRLIGLAGNDTLVGDGPSSCYGGAGADVLIGGPGIDLASYDEKVTPLIIDIGGADGNDGASGEHDTVSSDIENVFGGQAADLILGNAGPNVLRGGIGNDSLFGLDGDDTLEGYTGDDALYGGNGADTLNGQDGNDACNAGAGGLTEISCER